MLLRSPRKVRKGQALVEYALLTVCIAVVCAVAVSVLGQKTSETLAVAASVMPGASAADNAPIQIGTVIPTKLVNGSIVLNTQGLINTDRYANVLGSGGAALLVTSP